MKSSSKPKQINSYPSFFSPLPLLFLSLFISIPSFAQLPVTPNKKAEQNYRQAISAFHAKEYDKTLELLEKTEKIDTAFPELYLLRADVYNRKQQTQQEIKAIRQALVIDTLKYPAYYYSLAESYFSLGDYRNGLENYRKYLQKDKTLKNGQKTKKQIQNCEFAINALKTQTKRPITPYITSEHDVYWPSIDVTRQTVLYTALEKEEENIWMRKDSCRYPLNLNTPRNEGTQSLTADGQMIYFTACGRPEGCGSCDIYVAYRIADTVWSQPINLGHPINTEEWDAQPAISADGTKLYFASTREGGQGGSDIWFSRLIRREPNGRQFWTQPKCLYFNTEGDEMAPFLYYDNKTLFFSSDNYPGMGRKDIYKVDVNQITTPLNIGTTVNTQKDEMGFMVDATGKWGYFASDISGKKNIYKYRLDENIECREAAYIRLLTCDEQEIPQTPDRLTVMAVSSGDTLAHYDDIYTHENRLACVPANTLLLISALKQGYMYYSDTLQVETADIDTPKTKKITLRKIENNLTLILKGVFFDLDDHHLKPESENELKQIIAFMRLNPNIQIEIAGYTDDSGTDEHNLQLSENRAFEVYAYLFMNRIPKERMTYKGYGKDNPKAPNNTEEGKAINRRTEIKITKK